MKKRVTVNQARLARNEEIKRLNQINPFTAPTKGVDSGASGKALELEFALPNSRKTQVATSGKIDGWLYVINEEGKKKRQGLEIKTNAGRLENILNLADDRLVCYRLDVNNSNLKASFPTFITSKKNFVTMLERAKSIRTNALDRKGQVIPAMIQLKKSWAREIDKYITEFPRSVYREPGQIINIDDIL